MSSRFLSTCAALFLAGPWLVAQPEGDYEQQLARAVALDERLQSAEALAIYEQLDRLRPDQPAILLGMARQLRHLVPGTSNRTEKTRLLRRSLELSNRAVALAPGLAEAHVSQAITYGKLSPLLGTKEKLAASTRMKAAAEQALRLDSRQDLAWHLLGRWHAGYAEVSGARRAMGEMIYGKIPTSTWEEAAAAFEKARALDPKRLIHVAELGRAYAAMGRTGEARKLLNQAVAMPATEKDDPEAKQRAREALAALR